MKKLEKIWFMFRRFLRDFQTPLQFDIQDESRMNNELLEEYYLLFKEEDMQQQKGGSKSFEFDSKGIPVVPSYIDVEEKGFHYYPITIGQYGLAIFHTYLNTNLDYDKNRFLAIADWFSENYTEDEKGVYWLTHTKKPEYQVEKPWVSSFSQSRAISILLRAYLLTDEKKYLSLATKALTIFDILNSDGGVKAISSGHVFYEEYTAPFNIMVLDGAFFSMYGLFDYYRLFPDDKFVKKLIDQGLEGLIQLLPSFDMKFWIRYSLTDIGFYPKNEPATRGYFYLILTQLNTFYLLTKREEFKHFSRKFSKYDTFVNIIKMYIAKYKALKQLNRL